MKMNLHESTKVVDAVTTKIALWEEVKWMNKWGGKDYL